MGWELLTFFTLLLAPILPTLSAAVDDNGIQKETFPGNGTVTLCRPGYGYPEKCPRPEDPENFIKCCRHYNTPRCCESRARKVCANKNKGALFVSGWDIDPEPDMAAIFCPEPDQSEEYTSCGYTRGDMSCYNRDTATIIVWVTTVFIFGIAPLAFGIFFCISVRSEKRQAKERLAAGIIVSMEAEIEHRKTLKLAERASANKAETKAANQKQRQSKETAVDSTGIEMA